VVRHPLVQRIVKAYEKYQQLTGEGRQLALKLGDTPAGDASPSEAPLAGDPLAGQTAGIREIPLA